MAHSIRDSVKKYYSNAISITDGIFDGYNASRSVRYIFPDENSKIYVFDGKSKLTRVYTLENGNDFILKQYGMSLNDSKHENHKELSICPEYGVEKIKEISEYIPIKDGLSDMSMHPTNLLRVKKDTESIIICEIDGQQKGYIYKNGRIIETNEERVQEYSQLIDEYETERESRKYDEETQKIKENFFDRKRHEKCNIEYETECESRKYDEKRGSHEELEDKLDEEELIEAYEDNHGIGKELLSKIKKLFMDKGEK